MQETLVQSLGQEDPLKKEMATHTSVLAWEIPREAWLATFHGGPKGVRHELATKPQCY